MNPLRSTSRLLTIGAFLFFAACSSSDVERGPAVYYPQPPAPPRIQFLRTISIGSDVEDGRSSLDSMLFGESQVEKGLMAPYGVTFHNDIIYVCDPQQGVVITIDLAGGKMHFVETEGRGNMLKPMNLAFSEDGRLFVADVGREQVLIYDEDFNLIKEIGPLGEGSKVVDVEVANGKIYYLDGGLAEVHVFDLETYEELLVFGHDVDAVERHNKPTNLSVDSEGNSYVVDTVLCQIMVWDKDGKFKRSISRYGDIVGTLARPKGIALDDDKLFVIDSSFENCQIFDMDGLALMFFGNPGVGPGNLYLPAGVWVGEEGLDLFDDYIEDGFHAEKIIAITNLYGPFKLNLYAMGKADGFEYVDNEEARGVLDIKADSEENSAAASESGAEK